MSPLRVVLMVLVAIVVSAGAALPAHGDVFIWKDPQTGGKRVSNIAPDWLREPVPGKRMPKVEVIRDRKIIDPATALVNPQPQFEPPSGAAATPTSPAARNDDD